MTRKRRDERRCPRCRGTRSLRREIDHYGHFVRCITCGYYGDIADPAVTEMLARARRLHREARDLLIARMISSGEMNAELRYLTAKEAADELNVSPGMVYTWLREKRFEGAVRINGRQWAIPAPPDSPPALQSCQRVGDKRPEGPQTLSGSNDPEGKYYPG